MKSSEGGRRQSSATIDLATDQRAEGGGLGERGTDRKRKREREGDGQRERAKCQPQRVEKVKPKAKVRGRQAGTW